MTKMKKPISILLSILMMLSVFSGMTLTVGAAEKTIAEGVIFKLGDTIVPPGDGVCYVKADKYGSPRRVYNNGTITQFEGDEYSYTLQIDGWGIYTYIDMFEHQEELYQGMSVLGITFTGSGTESDPYMLNPAIGVVESTWAGEGEGTEASPWLIKDLNDLRTLSANVSDGMTYSGKYLKLTADIDCGSDNWEPIGGANAKMFMGTFDGDSHTITYNVAISENDNPKGLFANIGSAGTVKNLNVAGSIVNTAEYAGPAGGIAAYNYGLIENCYSAVDITKGCDRGTGGIATYNEEGGTISYCAASGNMTWTGGTDSYAYVAGITGSNYYGFVNNCAMLGDVSAANANGSSYAGRLIGRQFDASYSHDCYYLDTMTVTGEVFSDSAEAKTKDELKDIGQAAYDAGYTVYGLALGAVASNPNQDAANDVIALIEAIGTVENTPESKAKVAAAKAAYDALTDEQKALVTNVEFLTAAEDAVADFNAANDVIDLIDTIGTVENTAESKAKVEAAKAAYDALTPEQKALVTNVETLTAAEDTVADFDAANDVIDLIDTIGTVENTAESKAKVEAAKAAYDALTPEQKALVTNVETLTAAEAAVADFNAVPDGTALTDQLPETPGIYYLTQDITISSTWSVPSGETILDLNGYGIRMTGTGTVIDVCRDSSCILTLNDSRPTNSGGENRPTGILGGYITGGTGVKQHEGRKVGANCGGGIFVYNAGLNINGGTITGNHANRGGGVFIDSGCTVNMTGGAITGNTCVNYGGGVFLSEDSTFNVSNSPVITENRFTSTGNVTNIHLQVVKSQAEITIASPGLTAGAKLGIYELTPNSRQVTKGYSTYHSGVDPGTYFSCDTAGWTYKVNSNGELLSVPAFTVTWLNDDGTLIDTTTVAGDTVPTHADATKAADAQYSYTFSGWSNGTTIYAPDELPAVMGNVTYKATFTKIAKYTVTVPSDCTVSQTLPAGSDYYLATVQAPLEKDGKYFTYWQDAEGRIVGTYRTYTFYVGSDMALTPVYSTEADYAAERAKAVYAARALNVISTGEGAYAILVEHSVSTTDSINSHGVLVTTDASLANADSMKCENQNDIMHNFTASTTETTKTGMLQINAQLTGDTVYVRPYIIDGSGEYHYFDIKSFALSASGDAAEEVVMLDSKDLDLTAENADGDAAAEAPADDAGEATSIISTILEVVMNLIQRIVNYIKLALSIVK